MLVMIPVNGIIARFMKKLQKAQMKNKDSRTRLMTEILANMKSIKLYGWGSPFKAKLDHIRNDQELHTLKKIGAAQAFASFTWSSTPFLVSCMYWLPRIHILYHGKFLNLHPQVQLLPCLFSYKISR